MKATAAIVLVCGAAAVALAGPTHPGKKHAPGAKSPRPPQTGGADAIPFADNFDSYANGSGLALQGGWVKWDPATSVDATVSNAQSVSPSNSLRMAPQTDIVQTGTAITAGKWELKCMTYYPSTNNAVGANDGAFIIGLNRFNAGGAGMGNDFWSAQVQWMGTVVRNYDLQTENTPMVTNQWVPFRMVIDLTTDKYDAYYNGVNFVVQRAWSTGTSTPGQISITAFDFYGGNAVGTLPFEFFIDDLSLTEIVAGCYANCDGSTAAPVLNANDFNCFLNKFAAGDSYANCDGSSTAPVLNANDFNCFLNKYAAGCP